MLYKEKFKDCQSATLMNRAFGDVLSTVTNDVDTLSNGLQQTFYKGDYRIFNLFN